MSATNGYCFDGKSDALNNNFRTTKLSRKFIVYADECDKKKRSLIANWLLLFFGSSKILILLVNYFDDRNIHNISHTLNHFDENTAVVNETMLLGEPAALNWTSSLKRLKFLHINIGVERQTIWEKTTRRSHQRRHCTTRERSECECVSSRYSSVTCDTTGCKCVCQTEKERERVNEFQRDTRAAWENR